jgi:hypothetical protein
MSLEGYRGEEEGGSELNEDMKGKEGRSSSRTILLADGIKSDSVRNFLKNILYF